MSETQTIAVHILDREYQVACPPDERAALEQAAHHLDAHMRTIRQGGKVLGLDRIAVMAALNLSHELLTRQREFDAMRSTALRQISRLGERIDDALAEQKQMRL